jgi:hypothetical protein
LLSQTWEKNLLCKNKKKGSISRFPHKVVDRQLDDHNLDWNRRWTPGSCQWKHRWGYGGNPNQKEASRLPSLELVDQQLTSYMNRHDVDTHDMNQHCTDTMES